MSSVNKVGLVGRVGQDPECKVLDSGTTVATFSVATNRTYGEKETDWHRCVAFGKVAEIIESYVRKGSLIYIDGAIEYSQYEKEGVTVYSTSIKVNSMQMLGSKADNNSGGNNPDDDSDLPF